MQTSLQTVSKFKSQLTKECEIYLYRTNYKNLSNYRTATAISKEMGKPFDSKIEDSLPRWPYSNYVLKQKEFYFNFFFFCFYASSVFLPISDGRLISEILYSIFRTYTYITLQKLCSNTLLQVTLIKRA